MLAGCFLRSNLNKVTGLKLVYIEVSREFYEYK